MKKVITAILTAAAIANCIPVFSGEIIADTITTSSYTNESGDTVYTTEDGFEYTIANDEITITKYTGDAVDLTIPDYIDGLPVTVLDSNFIEDNYIKTLKTPQTLKIIRPRAFSGGITLTKICLNEGLEEIDTQAFMFCPNIQDIIIPYTVREMGSLLFNLNIIKEITILSPYAVPDFSSTNNEYKINCYENSETNAYCMKNGISYKSLGIYMPDDFMLKYTINDDSTATITGCNFEYISELNIPEYIDGYKIKAIGDSAFENYKYLKKVYMPDTIENLGLKAFYHCDKLENVRLSKNIKNLRTYTETIYECGNTEQPIYSYSGIFHVCGSLKKVIIPEGIETIEYNTFNCSELEKIVLPKSLELIQSEDNENNTGVYISENLIIYTYPDAFYSVRFAEDYKISYKFIGDISGNNEIDSIDALMLLNAVVGNSEKTDDMEVCDFDYDGQITSADALKILQYTVGSIDSLY